MIGAVCCVLCASLAYSYVLVFDYILEIVARDCLSCIPTYIPTIRSIPSFLRSFVPSFLRSIATATAIGRCDHSGNDPRYCVVDLADVDME